MLSRNHQELPTIGFMAYHRFAELDPRLVIDIDATGQFVKIDILGAESDWLPVENYTYKE